MLNIGEFARLGHVSPRMLRHYDEIGLLKPEQVDPTNGYRLYAANQLSRLHRILALHDLGFTLEQVRGVLEENPAVDQLRGMLRMRQAQIEQTVAAEQERLHRVEAHLRALEGNTNVDVQDIAIKKTQPIRIAEAVAHGLTHAELASAWERLLPEVLAHLAAVGANPGIAVGKDEYEGSAEDGTITLHAGVDVGDEHVPDGHQVRVAELPVVETASVVYRGPMDGIPAAWEALISWVDDSGYRLVGDSRELYHEHHEDHPDRHVTELQAAIAR
jgi:DNA-binding transcriptional MerR regulator